MDTRYNLKDEAYYEELYDRLTIDECKRWEAKTEDSRLKSLQDPDPKKAKIKQEFYKKCVVPISLYFVQGERYADKSQTIREWMDRDQARDDHLANAELPRGTRCLGCSSSRLELVSRDLMDSNGKEKVVFLFTCSQCGKRRAYWEDGKEWEPRPNPCPKCHSNLETIYNRDEKIITTKETCKNCGHEQVETLELNAPSEKTDPNFEADRKKYCLSPEEGGKYLSDREKLKQLNETFKDAEEHKGIDEVVAKIKQLKIAEVQNLLAPLLEEAGYIKFDLGKPEVTRDIAVGFTVQDNKPGRKEYDSVHELKKLISLALVDTNWRLMSEGISYKLGFLSGRLHGCSGQEQLRKLVYQK